MIAWSIEAAIQSDCFDRVLVSTDDEEIAQVAQEWGAEVPFVRPPALSHDHVETIPVIRHATQWLINDEWVPEFVCCIYATAPFISSKDIERGYLALREADCDYAFSVTRYAYPIQRALSITHTGRVAMLYPEHFNTRSQDLMEGFHDAGQFYWGRRDAWIRESPLFAAESVPVILPTYRVHDIDTPEDWVHAEWMSVRGPIGGDRHCNEE